MTASSESKVEAALIVPVPEVEPLVGPFRMQYDPSASAGVPAHITINYPFMPGIEVSEGLCDRLERHFIKFEPFDFYFNRWARFPDVLYLPPEPSDGFILMIESVAELFPESAHYADAFDSITPHLTIAQVEDPATLTRVAQEVGAQLSDHFPIAARARAVCLMDNRTGRWETRAVFPFDYQSR